MTSTSMTTAPVPRPHASTDGAVDVPEAVTEVVEERPWLQSLMRAGWYAKGAVYLLFGALAVAVARQRPSDDEASPEGALGLVAEQPGGRLLLGVLATGLVLYATWRVLSVLVIRGRDARAVLERIGYGASAAFYAVLAVSAFRHVLRGSKPDDSYTIERISRALLESTVGRVVLVVAGLVVIAVGLAFLYKAVKREHVDHLDGIGEHWDDNHGMPRVVFTAGVIGWAGRGLVTLLVGWFVVRAALLFDPADAHGFDGALRAVADSGVGAVFVLVAAVGLAVYGVYCLISAPRRRIADSSTGARS